MLRQSFSNKVSEQQRNIWLLTLNPGKLEKNLIEIKF